MEINRRAHTLKVIIHQQSSSTKAHLRIVSSFKKERKLNKRETQLKIKLASKVQKATHSTSGKYDDTQKHRERLQLKNYRISSCFDWFIIAQVMLNRNFHCSEKTSECNGTFHCGPRLPCILYCTFFHRTFRIRSQSKRVFQCIYFERSYRNICLFKR